MKKYTLLVEATNFLEVEVIADNEEEAKVLAMLLPMEFNDNTYTVKSIEVTGEEEV